MSSKGMPTTKPVKLSLTEQILALCASGRFGVREAIAATTNRERKGQTRNQAEVVQYDCLRMGYGKDKN